MYPYELFLGLTFYEVFLVLGILAALVIYRVVADKKHLSARLQNLTVICGVFAIILGYGSAVLFQAVNNWLADGKFEINNGTGATFYGGLIGGVAVFLLLFFVGGGIYYRAKGIKRDALADFFADSDIGAASIAAAHGLGRIGCLLVGCCHGECTDSWIGVWNEYLGCKTVPVQLFEALFLLSLATFLVYRSLKWKTYALSIYLTSYGVWRFFIEFLRSDDRGASPIPGLSPSQFIAIILVIAGIAFGLITKKLYLSKLRSHSEEKGNANGE
ncbi:MAG: prolipoprotein diacylglyceryl transferase [Clostridia bacterium]|nr:prolipoprotein diacylglyceryl transferase [Clostridia bacterium]